MAPQIKAMMEWLHFVCGRSDKGDDAELLCLFVPAEAINNAAGFGFNGYDDRGRAKWDLVKNVSVQQLEVSHFRSPVMRSRPVEVMTLQGPSDISKGEFCHF